MLIFIFYQSAFGGTLADYWNFVSRAAAETITALRPSLLPVTGVFNATYFTVQAPNYKYLLLYGDVSWTV